MPSCITFLPIMNNTLPPFEYRTRLIDDYLKTSFSAESKQAKQNIIDKLPFIPTDTILLIFDNTLSEWAITDDMNDLCVGRWRVLCVNDSRFIYRLYFEYDGDVVTFLLTYT